MLPDLTPSGDRNIAVRIRGLPSMSRTPWVASR